MKFEPLPKPHLGGSNWNYWFADEVDKAEWIGKISFQSVQRDNSYDEYKEHLASQIYSLFGVAMPQTLLINQLPAPEARNYEAWRKYKSKPRIHIMSKFMFGFQVLGKNFMEDYKSATKAHPKQLFSIGERKIPLKGFGRTMVVSILIHDFDFIGNFGGKIGLLPKEDGKYFEILKIDPGEALTLSQRIKNAQLIHNPISKRGAVGGTNGKRMEYENLNSFDQKEFVKTLKEILDFSVLILKEIFLPYIKIDKNFEISFEELLNRRRELLGVFADEIGDLIGSQITNLEEKQAEELMTHWDHHSKGHYL